MEPNTARDTLNYAAGLICEGLSPGARAAATAATFRELAKIGEDLPLTPADLAAALSLLGMPLAADEPGNVQGRRKTCREIAELLGQQLGGEPQRLVAVWRAVEQHFDGTREPRCAAIAETAAREAAELESGRFSRYRRKGLTEARPYRPGEDIAGISISETDRTAGSPRQGDWIARNPDNHADQWLVAAAYWDGKFDLVVD